MLTGVKMTHVQYKGVANAMTDLISGQIEVCFPPAPITLPFIQAGRVRALGITGLKRWSQLPNVPTLEESGVKGYKFFAWYGLWFPAGTPAAYVDRIQSEVGKAVQDPEVRKRFEDQGLEPVGSKLAEFEKSIQEELAFNKKLTTSIGIVPQ
jgi:tripartite-type tricarboxylate transporter receptor subunit TctC